MKISVIMPAFNAEDHIIKSVNSVLNQSYKNLELIVINDGSTDKTVNLIKNIQDSRLIIINQNNKGVSSARNRGIEIASGDYIAFLDADDWYSSNYLEYICMSSHDVYLSGYNIVTNGNSKKNKLSILSIRDKKIFTEGSGLLMSLIGSKLRVSSNNWVIKRNLIVENGIKFEESLSWCEDILFFSNVLLQAKDIVLINQYLTFYNNDVDEEHRLSTISLSRIPQEVEAMKKLKASVNQSDLDFKSKNRIIELINEYRIPATTTYTLLEYCKERTNCIDLHKVKLLKHNRKIKMVNGLRSLKLRLAVLKLEYIINRKY